MMIPPFCKRGFEGLPRSRLPAVQEHSAMADPVFFSLVKPNHSQRGRTIFEVKFS